MRPLRAFGNLLVAGLGAPGGQLRKSATLRVEAVGMFGLAALALTGLAVDPRRGSLPGGDGVEVAS